MSQKGRLNNNWRHGLRHSRTYNIWHGMLQRCDNAKAPNYYLYGGRGISVCDKWRSFKNFFEDMGEAPRGFTLNRIDNNGNYTPGNCNWIDRRNQQRDTRLNHWLIYNGEMRCLIEWAEISGLGEVVLTNRIQRGWSIEDALTRPVRRHTETDPPEGVSYESQWVGATSHL
jgi:hypothetical protein